MKNMSQEKATVFYTKTAVKHLALLIKQIEELSDQSNLNMYDSMKSLEKSYIKLVEENPNYAEAEEILISIIPFLKGVRYSGRYGFLFLRLEKKKDIMVVPSQKSSD